MVGGDDDRAFFAVFEFERDEEHEIHLDFGGDAANLGDLAVTPFTGVDIGCQDLFAGHDVFDEFIFLILELADLNRSAIGETGAATIALAIGRVLDDRYLGAITVLFAQLADFGLYFTAKCGLARRYGIDRIAIFRPLLFNVVQAGLADHDLSPFG